MEVLPAVLPLLPRYARGLGVVPTARHKGVVDHREGVVISPFDKLLWDEEQDESLPGEGKGGIVQLAFAGKTSTSVLGPEPPEIIRPAQWKVYFSPIVNGCKVHS